MSKLPTQKMNFNTQLKVGQQFEASLQETLSKAGLKTKAATKTQQKQGIDFTLTSGKKLSIECKWDKKSRQTGNIFMEVVTGSKMGCVMTCKADYMVWKLGYEDDDDYLLVKPYQLIEYLVKFSKERDTSHFKTCRNSNGYAAVGSAIPVKSLDKYIYSSRWLVEKIKELNAKDKTV